MKKRHVAVAVAAMSAFALAPTSVLADQPPARRFLTVLNAAEEVPLCAPATNAARGLATFTVTDEAAGTVAYTVIANNLPGDITAAHIHLGARGVAGDVVQGLALTPGAENGVVGRGTFTNPTLVAAIRANPDNYYVNVHTGPLGVGCPAGVIRGQLDSHGPFNR